MGEPLIRIGFLGAGFIATYHSKCLRPSSSRIERAGVFDPDTKRAQTFASLSGHTVCASEEEVLAGCDAVYICTWTSEHARLVHKAVAAGVHVFCEKPLAFTGDEARAMADAAQAAGITNQVGLVLRRSAPFLWARHLIEDPAAGRVMSVVFRDDQYIPIQGHYASTWRADKSRAGAGTLLEHSIHDIDLLRFLVGEVRVVSAHTSNFHGHDGIEDVATVALRFANQATATLSSIWHDNLTRPSMRRVEIFCERRTILIEGDTAAGPVSWTDSDGATASLGGESLESVVSGLRDGTDNQDTEFIRALTTGSAATPDLYEAVAAHRIVDAIYLSAAANGSPVEVV